MIRVIFGEDDFSVEERVREIAESIGQPEVRDPNTSVFEGDSYSKDEVLGAASAIPFLADKRLVLVRGLLGRLDGGTSRRSRSTGRIPEGDWTHLGDQLARHKFRGREVSDICRFFLVLRFSIHTLDNKRPAESPGEITDFICPTNIKEDILCLVDSA